VDQEKRSSASSGSLRTVSAGSRVVFDKKTMLKVIGKNLTRIVAAEEGDWFVHEVYDEQKNVWGFKFEVAQ
jgi:hypothetical protein